MSTITIAPHVVPARPALRRPAPRGQVRLTARGRVVVFVLAFVVVAAVAILLASGSVATQEQGSAEVVEVVTVAPGDTLWGIASSAAAETGEGDVRDMMQRIEELNAIDASLVYVGQELRVPAS